MLCRLLAYSVEIIQIFATRKFIRILLWLGARIIAGGAYRTGGSPLYSGRSIIAAKTNRKPNGVRALATHRRKKNIDESVDTTELRAKGDELIGQDLPKIQAHFRETVEPAAADMIHNDVQMTKYFEGMYGLIPLPIRLVIKKPAFVDFCLQNRYRIAGIEVPTAGE